LTSDTRGIKPFSEFFNSLQVAKPDTYLAGKRNDVMDDDAFVEMKEYLIDLYEGVEVTHSFVDENGWIFDCIPIDQQPSVRRSGQKVAIAPDIPNVEENSLAKDDRKSTVIHAQLSQNRKDKFGNLMFCPTGTIPQKRNTLEWLVSFKTLQNFFQKDPLGSSQPPHTMSATDDIPPASGKPTHRYAIAIQQVRNLGGHSKLNVMAPVVDGNRHGHAFSLSQQWYAAGRGEKAQLVEVGWQVYPARYKTAKPVLFVYYTPDNYSHGEYNDGKAFVKTSSVWALEGSISYGPKKEIEVAVHLDSDKWWIYIGGTKSSNAIGYYPVSVFGNGPMKSGATRIEYGGETAGESNFPPMGSGAFGTAGFPNAAYQRDISYFPLDGGASIPQLTLRNPTPKCYKSILRQHRPDWNLTLYYGGPGGRC
jgi:Neprosin